MAESYVDKVANELADMALADQEASGDVGIVDEVGKLLGASSQTLQETYLTAVRVRRAEARARDLLERRQANGFKNAPPPKAAPLQGLSDEDKKAAEAEIARQTAENESARKAADQAAREAAEIEAEIEAATARKAKQEAAQKAADEEARKAAAARKAEAEAKAKQEAEKKAAEAAQPVVGPWDLEDGAEPAPALAPESKPAANEPANKSPAMPRRVKR